MKVLSTVEQSMVSVALSSSTEEMLFAQLPAESLYILFYLFIFIFFISVYIIQIHNNQKKSAKILTLEAKTVVLLP